MRLQAELPCSGDRMSALRKQAEDGAGTCTLTAQKRAVKVGNGNLSASRVNVAQNGKKQRNPHHFATEKGGVVYGEGKEQKGGEIFGQSPRYLINYLFSYTT